MAKDRPKGPITTKDPLEAADGLQKIFSMAFYSQHESYHKETYNFVTKGTNFGAGRVPGKKYTVTHTQRHNYSHRTSTAVHRPTRLQWFPE